MGKQIRHQPSFPLLQLLKAVYLIIFPWWNKALSVLKRIPKQGKEHRKPPPMMIETPLSSKKQSWGKAPTVIKPPSSTKLQAPTVIKPPGTTELELKGVLTPRQSGVAGRWTVGNLNPPVVRALLCVVLDSGFVYGASIHHGANYINYFLFLYSWDSGIWGPFRPPTWGESAPLRTSQFLAPRA